LHFELAPNVDVVVNLAVVLSPLTPEKFLNPASIIVRRQGVKLEQGVVEQYVRNKYVWFSNMGMSNSTT
jgi:hypothetical protein